MECFKIHESETTPILRLTQVCKEVRAEFRPLYAPLSNVSLRLPDFNEYISTFFPGDGGLEAAYGKYLIEVPHNMEKAVDIWPLIQYTKTPRTTTPKVAVAFWAKDDRDYYSDEPKRVRRILDLEDILGTRNREMLATVSKLEVRFPLRYAEVKTRDLWDGGATSFWHMSQELTAVFSKSAAKEAVKGYMDGKWWTVPGRHNDWSHARTDKVGAQQIPRFIWRLIRGFSLAEGRLDWNIRAVVEE